GRPNAGKSTLMNAIVGEKLAAVSHKAQTTWQRISGIRTEESAQAVFVDTPGLLEVRDLHQRAMLGSAFEALRDADLVLVLVDGSTLPGALPESLIRAAMEEVAAGVPVMGLLTKSDLIDEDEEEAARIQHLGEIYQIPFQPISASTGRGIDELWRRVVELLPASPWYFPETDVATQPVRFFVEELIRETVFELYDDEIPWAVVPRIEEFREGSDPLYLLVHLHVERKSQKGIVLGRGGHAIREMGVQARRKIEALVGRRVYLDLWVKVLPGWRRKRGVLARFGYPVPDEAE
ncbi:MAG: GTPase Era, partial [Longimicrobiales bacterium]|nr:GTPase Era [Longimicrobiales bacterium]